MHLPFDLHLQPQIMGVIHDGVIHDGLGEVPIKQPLWGSNPGIIQVPTISLITPSTIRSQNEVVQQWRSQGGGGGTLKQVWLQPSPGLGPPLEMGKEW